MHIHVDMLGGLAGDMFLAAALDAGLVERETIEEALTGLGFGDITVTAEKTRRGAIVGSHVAFSGWPPEEESDHRHLSTILELLDESDLPEDVTERASAMFRILGESESTIHGIPLEDVHFHECGALDSIFDFVAAAWIIERTEASWSCGPVPLGSGTVETDHGTVPVPVPATARLLDGFETVTRPVEAELVTPTGATILKTLRQISPDLQRPTGRVAASGYGAGTRQLDELSNVVRFLALDTEKSSRESRNPEQTDTVVRIVCEIDDLQPELVADAEEALMEAGALDVVRQPVTMKKGRQGTQIAVLGRPDDRQALVEAMFRHTTTFGVRVEACERRKLAREFKTVETEYGSVDVKLGYWDGELVRVSPEYESCRAVADEAGVATMEVYRAASGHDDLS